MKALESIVLFIGLIIFGSCLDQELGSNSDTTQRAYPDVDPAMWVHFGAFEKAASERGYRIDLTQRPIHAIISDIDQDRIAGTCSYSRNSSSREVIIDKEFWDKSSLLLREYIVFHELGHCVLHQDHREACLTNQTWASMMRSGLGSCRDNYTASTRAYYLDELFGLVNP